MRMKIQRDTPDGNKQIVHLDMKALTNIEEFKAAVLECFSFEAKDFYH